MIDRQTIIHRRQVDGQECDNGVMDTLAERLTQRRNELGWSKAELSRRAGLRTHDNL